MRLETIYHQRINTVLNHISAHLDSDLSLGKLASVAHFSPFHFHRIFKDIVGQTLNQYVNRARVEHAAKLMRADPELHVLDAAIICGYESAAGFSRAFKKHYGISPREWDRSSPLQERKINQVAHPFPVYTVDALHQFAQAHDVRVQIADLRAQRLAYIRVVDSYRNWPGVLAAHDRLMEWYSLRGGDLRAATLYGMSQDDPDVTPVEQCRFDWALPLPNGWGVDGPVLLREMPANQIAYVHAQGDLGLLDRIWQYLWRCWLPYSIYQPANWPAMEIYQQLPVELGWEQYDMWCSVPITAL